MPNPLATIVKKLKSTIIGDTSSDLIEIHRSLNKLRKDAKVDSKLSKFSDLLKAVNETSKEPSSEIERLLQDLGINMVTNVDTDRIKRYQTYEKIIENIPYMRRGLKVLVQNILVPEDYTKEPINIKIDSDDSAHKVAKSTLENILESFGIQQNAFEIIYNTCLYADYFIEISVADEILKQYKILENHIQDSVHTYKYGDREINIVLEDFGLVYNKNLLRESNLQLKQGVYLTYHPPHRVIKLGDQEVIGYLVVNTDITQLSQAFTNINVDTNLQQLVNNIITKIKTNKKLKDEIKVRDDLKVVLSKVLQSLPADRNNIQIRYVRPEMMQHFMLPGSNKLKPYGTSVLYGSEFLAKIIIAIQSSIMIQRITRSVDKQLIYVDIGSSRDVRRYIEQVKQTLERKRFSVDGVEIDEVPSSVSAFEYVYLPQKDGKRYIEPDMWTQNGDVASRVDDLKALRDALVANLEIPPSYIGIEENVEAKATLTEQNVVFASSVMSYQNIFANHFKQLLQKISDVTGAVSDDVITSFEVEFQKPISLIAERQATYFENVGRITEAASQLGIPKTYIIQKYLNIDADELEKLKIEESIDKIVEKQNSEEEAGGFGGAAGPEAEF